MLGTKTALYVEHFRAGQWELETRAVVQIASLHLESSVRQSLSQGKGTFSLLSVFTVMYPLLPKASPPPASISSYGQPPDQTTCVPQL